jgi:putative phosphonate metabolism protein
LTANAGRVALYWAPDPDSAFGRFGDRWLGREAVDEAAVGGLPAGERDAITTHPRHYGFHATLKPPFALAAGTDVAQVHEALGSFAAHRAPFDAPPLALKSVSGFLALVLSAASSEMHELAAACVRDFDEFRAPAPPEETAERRKAGLTPVQDAHLLRWGYPYVMEEFRFHLTLSGRLPAAQRDRVMAALTPLVAPFCAAPLRIDAIALFQQDRRDLPFRLVRRYALTGRATD